MSKSLSDALAEADKPIQERQALLRLLHEHPDISEEAFRVCEVSLLNANHRDRESAELDWP